MYVMLKVSLFENLNVYQLLCYQNNTIFLLKTFIAKLDEIISFML